LTTERAAETFPAPAETDLPDRAVIANDETLWTNERIGRELNPDKPLRPGAVRMAMHRAGIKSVRVYPADQVRAARASRGLRNRRSGEHS
jgi:hypothetical protein